MRAPLAVSAFTGGVVAAAFFGSRFNPGRGETREWYSSLEKPPFNPPDALFPIVWTALYAAMVYSAWRVWKSDAPERRTALGLWWTQLAINAAWSPLFFGAKKPALAFADIALLIPAVAAYIAFSRKADRRAAWIMTPYLGWICFAALLNAEIVRRN
jgi:benzodiazapine receptor